MRWLKFWKRPDKLSQKDLAFGAILLLFVFSIYLLVNSIDTRISSLASAYQALTESKGEEPLFLANLTDLLNDIASLIFVNIPFAIASVLLLLVILAALHLNLRRLARRVNELESKIAITSTETSSDSE